MNHVILLSGGTGTRAGAPLPKQYVTINGHMMVTYAVKPLLISPLIDRICIVCGEEWRERIEEDIKSAGFDISKVSGYAKPGENRQLSILNGLEHIMNTISGTENGLGTDVVAGEDDTVLIHDAARPFLATDLINRCYASLGENDGVMPVLPMKDTVYLSEDGNNISGLIDRSTVFAGQAPELFRLKSYYEANMRLLPDEILKINGASEPAVKAGMKIAMIPGDEKNTKVTTGEDMRKFENGA